MPTANRGQEVAGLNRLAIAVRALSEAVSLLGVGSEPGQAVLKALQSLSKHVPPGSVSPGTEMSTMQRLMQQQQQTGQQVSAMRAMGAPPPGMPGQ